MGSKGRAPRQPPLALSGTFSYPRVAWSRPEVADWRLPLVARCHARRLSCFRIRRGPTRGSLVGGAGLVAPRGADSRGAFPRLTRLIFAAPGRILPRVTHLLPAFIVGMVGLTADRGCLWSATQL